MKATAGNWLVVESNHQGAPPRRGMIVEVHGLDGAPPYLVRWDDTDTETLFFPGPDTHVLTTEQLHRR
ncbi:uncharacterized protein DUF1918 [Kribbella sp. VKM Ac-2571]|uniref:DUF1918 domain-containing protein n=1 Tax=Kribbella sp. VKM Ac-2571 TaxID=2512222 RepID=UPI00105D4734|nr:DUF1918 domain-containing protein [Kribbella sp. VKM Ac-2571]TDO58794.1 uncharacterized protein DUF1918 [Kribbella sp. VKM Ac-2571]